LTGKLNVAVPEGVIRRIDPDSRQNRWDITHRALAIELSTLLSTHGRAHA
jgi:hypothetical protein